MVTATTRDDKRETLSVRQLAIRWSVGEPRIRSLIGSGFLVGTFKVPASGRYGETIRIPITTIEKAETKWAIDEVPTTERTKRRRNGQKVTLNHFPELSSQSEDDAGCPADE